MAPKTWRGVRPVSRVISVLRTHGTYIFPNAAYKALASLTPGRQSGLCQFRMYSRTGRLMAINSGVVRIRRIANMCCMCTFPGQREEVSRARRLVARYLDGSPVTDDAVLLVSELAANACAHSAS